VYTIIYTHHKKSHPSLKSSQITPNSPPAKGLSLTFSSKEENGNAYLPSIPQKSSDWSSDDERAVNETICYSQQDYLNDAVVEQFKPDLLRSAEKFLPEVPGTQISNDWDVAPAYKKRKLEKMATPSDYNLEYGNKSPELVRKKVPFRSSSLADETVTYSRLSTSMHTDRVDRYRREAEKFKFENDKLKKQITKFTEELEVEKYEKEQFKRIASNLQQSLETEKHQRNKIIHTLEGKFEYEKKEKLKLEQSYKVVIGELIPETNKELERLEDMLKLTLKKWKGKNRN